MALILAGLSLAIWIGLITGRHGFWLARERDTTGLADAPLDWPEVVAVVPARNEADVIAQSLGSLVDQDYPGPLRVIMIDDGSDDGTGALARALVADHVADHVADRIEVVQGLPLAPGWTGKLWAVAQGVDRAGTACRYLWLTDADIVHAPDTLRSLVTRAEAGRMAQVSLMAHLRCDSLAERMLVPAFVFFFQMLYPFGQVNRGKGPGAAAGGCMLVRRDALVAAGGIAAIRGALIDDCALGAKLRQQGPVWLGLTERSRSIRPYGDFGAVAAMIARSAYAQLRYSPLLLVATLAGLALVYAVPPWLALTGAGAARFAAIAAWGLMALAFQPMLAFYRRSPWWGLALPGIAAFYGACTLISAWQYARGHGGAWKGRAQAAMAR